MRRLVGAVVLAFGMLTGCGGTEEMGVPEPLGDVEQGLACTYPEMSCPPGSICIRDQTDDFYLLCRQSCPPSGFCWGSYPCHVTANGRQKYC